MKERILFHLSQLRSLDGESLIDRRIEKYGKIGFLKNSMNWDKAHYYKTRVLFADTDKMGVVYHGRYLEWFEGARTEMLRDHGLPYKDLEERVSLCLSLK